MFSKKQSTDVSTEIKAEFAITRKDPGKADDSDDFISFVSPLMKNDKSDKLNLASKSYAEFMITTKDASELKKCQEELNQIAKQVNDLGRREELLLETKNKLLVADDLVLQNILTNAFPQYKDGMMTCVVNREHSLCMVSITTREKETAIKDTLFKPYLKSGCQIITDGYSHFIMGDPRVHVVFQLSDRDNLINGIQQKLIATASLKMR